MVETASGCSPITPRKKLVPSRNLLTALGKEFPARWFPVLRELPFFPINSSSKIPGKNYWGLLQNLLITRGLSLPIGSILWDS